MQHLKTVKETAVAKSYFLPESWASVIVNDDWTSIEPEEIPILQNFFQNELTNGKYLILFDHETQFLKYHDAEPYGWLADDCMEFVLMD